jgi:hypothetical protein
MLADAQCAVEDVSYVVAHGSATPLGVGSGGRPAAGSSTW